MSNPLSLSGARVIDPILTTVARGYTNMALVFAVLFPIVMVGQRGGKILEFSADAFAQYPTERAPGSNIVEVEYGYGSQDYNLIQRALAGKVPRERVEEALAVPKVDSAKTAVQTTMEIINLSIERAAAGLATKASNYSATHAFTLAGGSQWSHADSTPAKYIESKKELIAAGIGREPNVMVVGVEVGRALRNNPDVIDRIPRR